MAELIAKSPCAGLLPITVGGMTLAEGAEAHMHTLAPYAGQGGALSDALRAAHGMAMPAPNRATGKEGARAIWFGRDVALLVGPPPDPALARHAAMTDQSDAWAVVHLEGAGARDVLARLTPLDLRADQFKRGHTARSELQHMMASVTRVGENAYMILVFRSMAETLIHDLGTAMAGVAARAAEAALGHPPA